MATPNLANMSVDALLKLRTEVGDALIPILRLSDLRLPNRGGRWT
jgi:hypothetical protein